MSHETVCRTRGGCEVVDATHLATAVGMGADRFITNSRRDFPAGITEVRVTFPDDLEVPAVGPS